SSCGPTAWSACRPRPALAWRSTGSAWMRLRWNDFEGAQVLRILVIGAGVVGVTSAYYLARAGHQVTVVEKEGEAATLASAGNAGLIAPGHSFAWASPSAPKELLRSLTVEDTALRVNPFKAPGMAVW